MWSLRVYLAGAAAARSGSLPDAMCDVTGVASLPFAIAYPPNWTVDCENKPNNRCNMLGVCELVLPGGSTCVPANCKALGKTCGTISDGCGGVYIWLSRGRRAM